MIAAQLSRLVINERSDEQLVFLADEDGEREFRIVIGVFEALAIDRALKGVKLSRPLTHPLVLDAVERMGGELKFIVVDELQDDTFFAKLAVELDGEERRIDARPSDALALALIADAPIYVEEGVFEAATASA